MTIAINIKQPTSRTKMVEQDGTLTRDGLQYFQKLTTAFQLILGDTSGGNTTDTLPPASSAPNYEVFGIKTTSDGNTWTLAGGINPSTGTQDLINQQGAWAATTLVVGTAQGAAIRLKSDGLANWYVC